MEEALADEHQRRHVWLVDNGTEISRAFKSSMNM